VSARSSDQRRCLGSVSAHAKPNIGPSPHNLQLGYIQVKVRVSTGPAVVSVTVSIGAVFVVVSKRVWVTGIDISYRYQNGDSELKHLLRAQPLGRPTGG